MTKIRKLRTKSFITLSPSHICALVLASKNFFTVAINNTVASHCVTVYDTMTILIMTLLIITILIQT